MAEDGRGTRDARIRRMLARIARSGIAEATFATLLLLYSETFFTGRTALTWAQFAVDCTVCLGAAASGRWPRAGSLVTGVGLAAFPLAHTTSPIPMAIMAALIPIFALGARGLERWRTAVGITYFFLLLWATLPLRGGTTTAVQSVIMWVILIAIVWLLGTAIATLQRRTLTLADERVAAVRSQRRSIARDLHDTVAYATTTMIMRAEEIKLRCAPTDPLHDDLDFIIATGRRSLRDLRGMMEALRRNDPSLEPDADESAWRIVSLAALLPQRVAELEAHGLTVSTQVDADLDALPESVRETLGKLIVEATSNMVKHAARPGPCRILIEATPDAVEAVFTNPIRATASFAGGGFGLMGARERVEALGGEFETTAASGTFLLRVSLPVGG